MNPRSLRAELETVWALVRRSANELLRVPGAAIPGVLAPTIFFLGLTSVFGNLTHCCRGFDTAATRASSIPVSLLQGAGFTGAATGVNLARDIEQGWFDRLLASPAPRPVLLAGLVVSASIRSLIPATVLFCVAMAIGAHFPGLGGLAIAILAGDGDGRGRRLLGLDAGAALPQPVGGAADAGGDVRRRAADDGLRPTPSAPGLAADGGADQPGHPRGRGGAAGLRRRGQLGRHLARAGGAGRPRRPAPSHVALRGMRRLAIDGRHRFRRLAAQQTLRDNWAEGERDGVHYAYTSPSPSRYPWQWYWDSCFAAIVWRRFDPPRAEAELRSLLAAMRDDGFIGHTIFWNKPVDLRRALFYNVTSRSAFTTSTIQPPLLAWAWRIAVGDPAAEPRIAAHHEWLRANRDLEGDGLLWIVQPDESGLDSSPKFDPVWGQRAHGRIGFPFLIHRNRARLGRAADPRRRRPGALRGDHQRALGPVAPRKRRAVDHPGAGRSALGRAQRPLPRPGPATGEPVPISTWAALAPLALPDLPEEIGRRLVEEHLLDPERYWTAVPPPSVSAQEPSFEPRRWKRRWSRATGAARPGSTRPGCSGSGCCGSATPSRRTGWRARSAAPSRARACASSTSRSAAKGSARSTSPGRPWPASWPSRTQTPIRATW